MASILRYLVLVLTAVFLLSSLLLGLSLGKKESRQWPRVGQLIKRRMLLLLVAAVTGVAALSLQFIREGTQGPTLETVVTPLGSIALRVSEDAIHREMAGAAVEKIKEAENSIRSAEREYDAEHFESAAGSYQTALQILESRSAYLNLALVRLVLSQFSAAEQAARRGLELVDLPNSEPPIEAALYNSLGIACLSQGRVPEAVRALQKAQALFSASGNSFGEADAIANIGIIYFHQGQFDDALAQHKRALELHRRIGLDVAVANDLLNLGNVSLAQHRYDEARKYYADGYAIHQRSGNSLGMANALGNLGNVFLEMGDPNEALSQHQQSLAIHRHLGNRVGEANDQLNIGNVYLETKDYKAARENFQAAARLAEEIGSRLVQANATSNLALVTAILGDRVTALGMFRSALQLQKEAGSRLGEAKSRLGLAEALLKGAEVSEGLAELRTAHQIFLELGLMEEAQRIERRLAEFGDRRQ